MKQSIVNILKLVIAFGLIYFLINKGYLDLSLLDRLNIYSITGVLLLSFLGLVVNNFRWTLLLKSQELMYSFSSTLKLSFIGIFFNFALPSSIGGDVVKAYYLVKSSSQQKSKAVMSVVVDRFLGLISMLVLAVFAMLMNFELIKSNLELYSIFLSMLGILVGVLLFLIVAFSNTVHSTPWIQFSLNKLPVFIKEPYLALCSYGKSIKQVIVAILLSFVSQFCIIMVFKIVGDAMGAELSLYPYLFAVPIGLMIMSLPIAPAGIGVGQMAFLYLFKVYTGEAIDVGTLGVTVFQMSLLVYGFVGCYFYVKNKAAINQVVTDVR